jgi:hypothetical protein
MEHAVERRVMPRIRCEPGWLVDVHHAAGWTPHVVIAAAAERYVAVNADPLRIREELQGRLDLRIGDCTAAISWRPPGAPHPWTWYDRRGGDG